MKRFVCFVSVLACWGASAFATDSASHAVVLAVADTCRVSLNSAAKVILVAHAPGAGGEAPDGDTDASKSLRYTSVVPSGASRSITVNWNPEDETPAGTSLALRAADVPAEGGSSAGEVKIGVEPRNLIVGIRSCSADGHALLVYRFNVDDATKLVMGATRTITVNFTLTDAF